VSNPDTAKRAHKVHDKNAAMLTPETKSPEPDTMPK